MLLTAIILGCIIIFTFLFILPSYRYKIERLKRQLKCETESKELWKQGAYQLLELVKEQEKE